MLKDSVFSLSSGDEAGSIGGVKSNVIKGEAKPVIYSFDIKIEGRNVMRRSEPMTQNKENCI